MANIIGTNGNDTLIGSELADTINGLAGNDNITGNEGDDVLTGGGGKDQFVYSYYGGTDTITDFAGVGKGTNPTAVVIAEVDTLQFQGDGFTAQNLLLTQNGKNLEISFEGDAYETRFFGPKVILQNFKLENLENLKASGAKPAVGNILFDGQNSITDSFNVLDSNSTDTSLGIKNIVTFLNDLNNNITGLEDSNDVVNGQGGNDKIDGLSGNDLLRGGAGNDSLVGGAGNDTLVGGVGNESLVGGNDSLIGGTGNDFLRVEFSTGDNTLNGGAGDDTLNAGATSGDNLLLGGDGNDFLFTSGISSQFYKYFPSSGNNILNGGTGDDTLNAQSPSGDNLLSGGDGNDFLTVSGITTSQGEPNFNSFGNNTLNGGAGNDTLNAGESSGNNLLSGGDGNDFLTISGVFFGDKTGGDGEFSIPSSGNNTLNGGTGDDTLRAEYVTGNNLFFGGDGNDSFYLSTTLPESAPSYFVTQTVDGGKGNDVLSTDYRNATGGITTTFNPTTNIGSITAGTYQVSYKNIERLDITGTQYDDLIVGSNGNDTLKGGLGNDILTGGKGNDSLIGEAGTDTFAFNNFNEGVDSIDDFNTTNELIRVSSAGFGGGLSSGTLEANKFTIGASATTSNQRFIYNSATGGLFFDLDGSGSGSTQVQFAQLSGGLSVTEKNFVVV
ncbi:calcium-binding protein [Nostoc flagelliforme FACHB-838]|uniref:Calcium-binding protein n=1 Tax=Nostoc flagelliforme FACHB-838 TaxID=2692904 RepID=A0ABR8DR54_9NOSO|nr:calcium-binding protein [Nostoc flagelliforme FACHB-838]